MISGGIEVINSHENHTSDWFYRQLIERSVFETAVLLQYQQPIKRTLPLKPLRKKKKLISINTLSRLLLAASWLRNCPKPITKSLKQRM